MSKLSDFLGTPTATRLERNLALVGIVGLVAAGTYFYPTVMDMAERREKSRIATLDYAHSNFMKAKARIAHQRQVCEEAARVLAAGKVEIAEIAADTSKSPVQRLGAIVDSAERTLQHVSMQEHVPASVSGDSRPVDGGRVSALLDNHVAEANRCVVDTSNVLAALDRVDSVSRDTTVYTVEEDRVRTRGERRQDGWDTLLGR